MRCALGDGAHFGNCQRAGISRQRHWLGVEVAAREHHATAVNMWATRRPVGGAALREHQGVVGHRVGLAHQHQRGVAQRVQAGAHHLGLAAQAIGVLHAVVAFLMGLTDLAARQQGAVILRHVDLPRLAPQRMDARVERAVAAARGVYRQGADD
jgi:hypothetical protein